MNQDKGRPHIWNYLGNENTRFSRVTVDILKIHRNVHILYLNMKEMTIY